MQGIDGKRVAALVGDGFEEVELMDIQKMLEDAGAIVTIVGTTEKSLQKIRAKRGFDDGNPVKAEELVADCTAEDFDALYIPGGASPDQIRTNRDVQRFVREFDAAKKPLFSMGHGAQVLISAQVTRGRVLTGTASIGDDIRNSGALYRDQPVVQDGNWISSRSAADAGVFGRAVLERLAATVNVPV